MGEEVIVYLEIEWEGWGWESCGEKGKRKYNFGLNKFVLIKTQHKAIMLKDNMCKIYIREGNKKKLLK